MTQKTTHGGTRPNSGRPKEPDAKKTISIRVHPSVYEFLRGQENTSLFVEQIVRRLKAFRARKE